MKRLFGIFLFIFIFTLGAHVEGAKRKGEAIEKGKKVSFDYTLTVDGKAADSSEGRGPLQYTHGEAAIIPGLERELEGMHVGDEKDVAVLPKDAYGELNPDALKEVSRSTLPADISLTPGMTMQARDINGNVFTVKISETKGDRVVIDFNHPLAGKTLNFHVKIVSIE